MTEIVAVDIGGTHARFAIAEIAHERVAAIDSVCTLETADHANLQTAWEEFGRRRGRALPSAVAIALAGPADGKRIKLTNNPWVIRPANIPQDLHVERYKLLNDFGAIGHAVAQFDETHFSRVCGARGPLPAEGVITIIGPGTGLGVAQLLRRNGTYHVLESEGGHIDFAPVDSLEDQMLTQLRGRFRRVSAERIASGKGLMNIYEILAKIEGRQIRYSSEKTLWARALTGEDSLASAALDRFCAALGGIAGDLALAHGASAVVIAGGIGLRLKTYLPRSGFGERFAAKGRFQRRMIDLPVKLVTHSQPGLFGAAAAFAREF